MLRIKEIRNIAPKVRLSQIKEQLPKAGLPKIYGNPQKFVQSIVDLENHFGTSAALLIGLMATLPQRPTEEYIEGFEIFSRIMQQLNPRCRINNFEGLESLFDHIGQQLKFWHGQDDFLVGLRNLEANLRGENHGVGNCIIGAGIFAALTLAFGHRTGEAHPIEYYHAMAFFPETFYSFGVNKNQPEFKQLEADPRILTLNVFSMVSSLINVIVSAEESQDYLHSRAENQALITQLNCAEAVNPHSTNTYYLRIILHQKLGNEKAAKLDRANYEREYFNYNDFDDV